MSIASDFFDTQKEAVEKQYGCSYLSPEEMPEDDEFTIAVILDDEE